MKSMIADDAKAGIRYTTSKYMLIKLVMPIPRAMPAREYRFSFHMGSPSVYAGELILLLVFVLTSGWFNSKPPCYRITILIDFFHQYTPLM